MAECGKTAEYYLGIDGGGTKTALLLCDRDGKTVGETVTAACNPMDIGFARAFDILRCAISEVCGDIPREKIAMFAGIAGGGSADAAQKLSDFFAEFDFCVYANEGDNRNILEAGLGDRDGISVIIGTGIYVQAKRGDTLYRAGGWGYFIDRGGSGFNLGRDALDAYYAAYDGSGAQTVLTELIGKQTGCTPGELVSRIYAGGKTFVASFAPLVSEAYRRGDRIADEILARNTEYIAHLILTVEQHLPDEMDEIPVVLCGGLSRDAEIVSRLERLLSVHGRLKIECLSREPVWGAAMAAKKLAEAEVSSC